MRVLYLVFNEGYSGDVDLAAEAIRLTRQLAALADDPEVHGLLALMLLHHARRRSRTRPDGSIVPLAEQDRSQWDTELIAEGIDIVQARARRDQLGEYQAQAAIAALHADAPRVEETDWVQIVEWYDELLRFADTPIVRLNRAVAVGEADGAPAGLAALAEVDDDVPRRDAVAAYLHEKNGDLELAARLYADAARNAPNLAERDHRHASSAPDSTSACSSAGDQKGTSWVSRPVPLCDQEIRQNSSASRVMDSPPEPAKNAPPAAPVSSIVNGLPCRRAHSATASATMRPSCPGVSTIARSVARVMSTRCIQLSRVRMVSRR